MLTAHVIHIHHFSSFLSNSNLLHNVYILTVFLELLCMIIDNTTDVSHVKQQHGLFCLQLSH
jgi:hypothetical protein